MNLYESSEDYLERILMLNKEGKKVRSIDLAKSFNYSRASISRAINNLADDGYRWFKKNKKEPNIVCEMDNYLDAIALANRNVGISIFPKTEYILNSSIVSKDIGEINANIEYLFVWRKGHQLSIVEDNFIDYIKSIFKVN